MDIIRTLKQEESKLQGQLKAVRGAIAALNGASTRAASSTHKTSVNGRRRKRTLSAAGRANIIRAVKARWAKIRAVKAKKAK